MSEDSPVRELMQSPAPRRKLMRLPFHCYPYQTFEDRRSLDDDDLDLKNLTARIREGKGVREGAGFMVEDYCRALEMTN